MLSVMMLAGVRYLNTLRPGIIYELIAQTQTHMRDGNYAKIYSQFSCCQNNIPSQQENFPSALWTRK